MLIGLGHPLCCHPLTRVPHWRRRVVVACDPSPRYDQHLRRENARAEGTVGPTAGRPIPFYLRLKRLNEQLRAANRSADAMITEPNLDTYA